MASPELLVMLILCLSLILTCTCNANQTHLNNAFGGVSCRLNLNAKETTIVGSSRSMMATSRKFAAFHLPGVSPSLMHRSIIVPQQADVMSCSRSSRSKKLLMFGKPRTISSPFQRHVNQQSHHPRRRQFLTFLAAASNDDHAEAPEDADQQNGMDEAFASLEALSPDDWNSGASDSGKSTKQEVGYYLEMQDELQETGKATQYVEEEENQPEELLEIDEMVADEDLDDDEGSNSEEEYPWTSINPILRLRGPVASGYGRGGKKLGVPTANVSAKMSLFGAAHPEPFLF